MLRRFTVHLFFYYLNQRVIFLSLNLFRPKKPTSWNIIWFLFNFSNVSNRRLSTGAVVGGQENAAYVPDSGVEGRQTTVTFTGLSPEALAANKPFTPLKKKSSLLSLWSNDSRDVKLKNLKQELEMDEHKIPLATLFSRLKTDPIMVWHPKRKSNGF